MKIKKTVTSVEEIEISLPYYSKSICYWYKVFSENETIQVLSSKYNDCGSVQIVSSSLAFGNDNQQCTAEEFEEKFNLVIEQLKKLI